MHDADKAAVYDTALPTAERLDCAIRWIAELCGAQETRSSKATYHRRATAESANYSSDLIEMLSQTFNDADAAIAVAQAFTERWARRLFVFRDQNDTILINQATGRGDRRIATVFVSDSGDVVVTRY